jgi:hypothetical protein
MNNNVFAMKKEVEGAFFTNPEKASARVAINSFMIGSLFMILTFIWTLNPQKFSTIILVQIVLAIPMLFVSSLAYAKVGYWKEVKLWDLLGWVTNNFGTIFVINVVGLITATFTKNVALIYFSLTLVLMIIYSAINIYYKPKSWKEKLFKFLFFAVFLYLGGLMPLL